LANYHAHVKEAHQTIVAFYPLTFGDNEGIISTLAAMRFSAYVFISTIEIMSLI
jgi:hypothetical protein